MAHVGVHHSSDVVTVKLHWQQLGGERGQERHDCGWAGRVVACGGVGCLSYHLPSLFSFPLFSSLSSFLFLSFPPLFLLSPLFYNSSPLPMKKSLGLCRLVVRSFGCSVGWSFGPSVGQSVGRSCQVSQLVGQSYSRSFSLSVGPLIGCSVGRSVGG